MKKSVSSSLARLVLGPVMAFGFGALSLSVSLSSSATAATADWPQWRGPNRDGASAEKGLLREWPKAGPKLVWQVRNVGAGFSTPAVVGERIYLISNDGVDNEYVQALSVADGKSVWTTTLGKVGSPDQKPSYPGSRSTPTVDGAVLFALSSDGDLTALETTSGKLRWKKNLRSDFAGKPGRWAYSESPLVDGNTLVCTPGGGEATVLALNKQTGAVLWKSVLPDGDEAGYSSPMLAQVGGAKQYVQIAQKGIVGIDAQTGKSLWHYNKAVSRFGANIPSPLVMGDRIYTSGAGTGGAILKLKGQGAAVTAEELFFEAKYPLAIGGVVKVGEFLYGTTGQALQCVDLSTGKIKWEERSIGTASLCTADGLLFLHGENGEVALVEASPEGYHEKGRFTPPTPPERANQMEKAWAYPVLANGRLYLRDLNVLWSFGVK